MNEAIFMEDDMNIEPVVDTRTDGNAAIATGFWSSLFVTALGASYFVVILATLLTGNLKLPPPEFVQIYAAIMDLLLCPALVMVIASVFFIVPKEKKIFAKIGLIFASIFTAMVTTNRFIQISVVRLSVKEGDLEGLQRFLPYDSRSVMFALEIFGFGFFLSLTLFFAAVALPSVKLLRKVKVAFFVYALLGMICIVGYVLNRLIVNIGFVAWGLVLYIGTAFLARYFYKEIRG